MYLCMRVCVCVCVCVCVLGVAAYENFTHVSNLNLIQI